MGRVCSTNVEKRNAYRIVVENSDGNRPLGNRRHRWMDHTEIGWGGLD
jgi:hypothetical protein